MIRRYRTWRLRQPSRILFVAVPVFGSTIVAAGLRASRRAGLRMIEVYR